MFSFRKTGIEITKKGVYVVSKLLKSQEKAFFHSLEEFLESKLSKGSLAVAVARDTLLVRKVRLPSQAAEDLEEALAYSADELFPAKGLFVRGHKLSEKEEEIEVLVWAMDEELYETLSHVKGAKLILPTPYLYPSEFSESELVRDLGEAKELNRYREGKLVDSFLLSDSKTPNLPQDEFLGARLALEALKEGYKTEFSFLDKRVFVSKRVVRYSLASLLIIFALSSVAYYNVHNLKGRLKEVKKEVSRLAPQVEEYNRLLDELERKRALIELAKHQRSDVLGILKEITYLLPKDTWLKRFSYKGKKVLLEGYTSSTTNLLRKLEDSGRFRSIKLSGTPRKEKEGESFSIELELK